MDGAIYSILHNTYIDQPNGKSKVKLSKCCISTFNFAKNSIEARVSQSGVFAFKQRARVILTQHVEFFFDLFVLFQKFFIFLSPYFNVFIALEVPFKQHKHRNKCKILIQSVMIYFPFTFLAAAANVDAMHAVVFMMTLVFLEKVCLCRDVKALPKL